MSTKTTFKRIALVAVAALTLGSFSGVSATAAQLANGVVLPTVAALSAPATATTGVEVKGIFSHNGLTNGYGATTVSTMAYIVAAPTTSTLAPNAPVASLYTGTAYTGTAGVTTTITNNNVWGDSADYNTVAKSVIDTAPAQGTNARITAYFNVAFTPDKVGSYTIAVKNQQDGTQLATWTVVATDPVQKSATAFVGTSATPTADATAAALTFASTASTTVKAYLTVRQYSTTDTTTAATAAISKDVVVAISKGLVSKTNDYAAAAASVTTAAATAAENSYYIFSNGTVGAASLTVTVGGVLVATKTITFNGVAKTLSAALTTGQKSWIAPSSTTTVTVTAKDEAGNAASNTPTITATSATTSVATVAVSGLTVTITGVAAGTSVITIADAATSSPAASTTYTVTVAPAVSATLPTMSFDKADYAPGELMTVTIAAAAEDNASFAAFTAAPVVSTNVVVVKQAFTLGAVALVGGKATWTGYAPASGSVTITATSSTGSSATAAVVTATATVSNEALDAASEAIDAANAATDAANAAAEAADAATAAAQDAADQVAALSTSVSAMIAALKKQITALTNLVIKIQKKVKA